MIVLAVDGGNSKTDLALVAADGALLAHARGPLSSPHHLGLDGCVEVLQRLVDEAGLDGRRAEVAQVLLAGVDFPDEEERLHDGARRARLGRAHPRRQRHVRRAARRHRERLGRRDHLRRRASTASASRPDGRHVRFPALGEITGDWGGGYDVGAGRPLGRGAQRGRPRAEDRARAARAGALRLRRPLELARAMHVGEMPRRRSLELAPARARVGRSGRRSQIGDRLADEIVALARAAFTRLGLVDDPVEVAASAAG